MSTRVISGLLTLTLISSLALAPAGRALAAEKSGCEQAALDTGLKPKGQHFGSIAAGDSSPGTLRRAVSLVGSLLDQPAPNPLYNVAVSRCERAAKRPAAH